MPLKKDGRFVHHDQDQWCVSESGPDVDQEFLEGRKSKYTHLRIERDPDVIRLKKSDVLKREGSLVCEICGFDYEETYGSFGKGFIEAHHLVPLSTLQGTPAKTSIADLIVICSNCHRMVHRCLMAHPALNGLEEIKLALLQKEN
jgi:predicted HNH restriction endonuclease